MTWTKGDILEGVFPQTQDGHVHGMPPDGGALCGYTTGDGSELHPRPQSYQDDYPRNFDDGTDNACPKCLEALQELDS